MESIEKTKQVTHRKVTNRGVKQNDATNISTTLLLKGPSCIVRQKSFGDKLQAFIISKHQERYKTQTIPNFTTSDDAATTFRGTKPACSALSITPIPPINFR